ncbi:hypothetical protein ACLF96_03290 [Helicobacter pylori]
MSVKEETEDEDFEELIKEVEKLENSYYFLKGENDKLQKQMHELENSYHF